MPRKLLDLSKDFIIKNQNIQPLLFDIYANEFYIYKEIWLLFIAPIFFAISFGLTDAYEDLFSALFSASLFVFVISARVFRKYREVLYYIFFPALYF